jgi:H+/Cl- antiporter ClcA
MNSRRVSKTLLFKQSFVNLLKLKSVLIILAAGLLLSGFIIFAVPQIFSSGIEAYYRLYINSSF